MAFSPDAERAMIRRPDRPDHFMRLKSVRGRVRVFVGETEIASTLKAQRLIEVGHDIYDPVLYLPREALKVDIELAPGTTHCPLKGDAKYYDVILPNHQREDKLLWSYEAPLDFSSEIGGLVAFYTDRVTIIEEPV